jgi:hypothetical protein
MKLDARALAVAGAVVWGGGILVVGLDATVLGIKGDDYGKDRMLALASVYPGHTGTPGIGNSLVGGLDGALDGAIGGAVLGWLDNRCAGRTKPA